MWYRVWVEGGILRLLKGPRENINWYHENIICYSSINDFLHTASTQGVQHVHKSGTLEYDCSILMKPLNNGLIGNICPQTSVYIKRLLKFVLILRHTLQYQT